MIINTFNNYVNEDKYMAFTESVISQFLIEYCPIIDIKNCKKFFKKFGTSKYAEDLQIKTFFLTFYSIAHYLKINNKTNELEKLSKDLYNSNEKTVCNIIDDYLSNPQVLERIKKDFNMITLWDSTEPFIDFTAFDRRIKLTVINIFCKIWKRYSNYHIKAYNKLQNKFYKKTDIQNKYCDKNFLLKDKIKTVGLSKKFLPKELRNFNIDIEDFIDMNEYNKIKNFI